MTLHRSFMFLAVVLGVTIVVLFGCSSDDDEEEIVAPEPEVEEIVDPDPPMGWDGDRNIRIIVGGKTEKELYTELYDKRLLFHNFFARDQDGHWARAMRFEGRKLFPYFPFYHSFPLSKEQYVIDVTVISMLEAGMEEPATIEEIRARYRELGCRPMTTEEALYLRLQFTDQPSFGSRHPLGEFYALMEDNGVDKFGQYLFGLVHDRGLAERFIIKRFAVDGKPDDSNHKNSFDPYSQMIWIGGTREGADFACVKMTQ